MINLSVRQLWSQSQTWRQCQSFGARTAQLVLCWTHYPAWRSITGSILLWAPGRGDFSLRVNMGSDSIPPELFSDESIRWGLVCAHMHSITQTQQILIFMSYMGECWQQKNTHSMYHPPRQNMTTSMVGLKNGRIHKNLTQKWWTPEI